MPLPLTTRDMLMKHLTISARQGCSDTNRNFFLSLFLLLPFAFYHACLVADEHRSTSLDLDQVEQRIHSTSTQLDAAADAVRSAKRYVAEKELELSQAHEAQREQPSDFNAHHLHHAQKRLALARLGLDSRIARFERIQQQLESLALSKLDLLAEQANASDSARSLQANATLANSLLSTDPAFTDEESDEGNDPIGSQLNTRASEPTTNNSVQTASLKVQNAKIFGAGIPGEISLEPAGADQFVGRFYAPSQNLSIFVGFRTDEYHNQEVPIKFAQHEYGQPFVFVLDLSDPDRPLTRVFEESVLVEEELSSI